MTVKCPHCQKEHDVTVDVPEYAGDTFRQKFLHWFHLQDALVKVAVIATVPSIVAILSSHLRGCG